MLWSCIWETFWTGKKWRVFDLPQKKTRTTAEDKSFSPLVGSRTSSEHFPFPPQQHGQQQTEEMETFPAFLSCCWVCTWRSRHRWRPEKIQLKNFLSVETSPQRKILLNEVFSFKYLLSDIIFKHPATFILLYNWLKSGDYFLLQSPICHLMKYWISIGYHFIHVTLSTQIHSKN